MFVAGHQRHMNYVLNYVPNKNSVKLATTTSIRWLFRESHIIYSCAFALKRNLFAANAGTRDSFHYLCMAFSSNKKEHFANEHNVCFKVF